MKKIILNVLVSIIVTVMCSSCATTSKLPAEDIEIFNTCKQEIAILKNPRISARSKEKYDAARSLSKKVDFSYTRTIDFLGKVFLDQDARVTNLENNVFAIVVYYQYQDKYISFEFKRFENQIISSKIKFN